MGPLNGNSQTQLLWSHSELSLTVASEAAHILGTLEKYPHLGGQSPPCTLIHRPGCHPLSLTIMLLCKIGQSVQHQPFKPCTVIHQPAANPEP